MMITKGLAFFTMLCIIIRANTWTITSKTCIEDETLLELGVQRTGSQGRDQPLTGIALQMLKRAERLVLAKQTADSYFHTAIRNCSNEHKLFPDYCGNQFCAKSQNATLLWSFPGSGNTFVRALTESATKVRTGSLMFDKDIARKMPGELLHLEASAECEKVSVIKAHPNIKHQFSMDCGFPVYPHCDRGIARAVFLVRHPFSASWAEFQRRTFDGHTSQAPVISKNADWWKSWSVLGPGQVHGWNSLWLSGGPYYEWMLAYGTESYYILRFEDLLFDKIREIELQSMLDFAGLSHLTTVDSVACAFSSDLVNAFHRKPKAHRSLAERGSYAKDVMLRILEPNDPESRSAHDAWVALGEKVCGNVWSKVEPVASLLGYTRNGTSYTERSTAPILTHSVQKVGSVQVKQAAAVVPIKPSFRGLVDWAKAKLVHSSFPFLILTFINEAYVDVLVNQLLAMMRFDETLPVEIGVVCTDAKSAEVLEDFGAPPCYKLQQKLDYLSNLWEMRVSMLVHLIENDISVLLTDVDAVWQRDPRIDLRTYLVPEFKSYSGDLVDVVAQRGSFPKNIYADWGATLCMGFAIFRATAATKKLLKLMEDEVHFHHDDQRAINTVLYNKRYFHLSFSRKVQYENSRAMDYGRGIYKGIEIKVGLLPEIFYVRTGCQKKIAEKSLAKSIVVHCLTSKTSDSKLAILSRTKNMYLKNESAYRKALLFSRKNNATFIERLKSIATS